MTQAHFHTPQQHSVINKVIVAVLTTAMIVVAGVLSFAQFAMVAA
jgi:hypothetical protein